MKSIQLFVAFFRVGILGYGGGPASIPLVHKEVVDKYKWMTEDDFSDLLALANTLPGPIATKMAGYIGYRVQGVRGMLNATIAVMLPTVLLMIILLSSLSSIKDQAWVAGMTQAVIPVVGVMLAILTWQFLKKSQSGLGWTVTLVMAVVTGLFMEWLGVHPGIVIACLLLAAIVRKDKKEERTS